MTKQNTAQGIVCLLTCKFFDDKYFIEDECGNDKHFNRFAGTTDFLYKEKLNPDHT